MNLLNRPAAAAVLPLAMLLSLSSRDVLAQGFGRQQAVGGVSIDADGILRNAAVQDVNQLRLARRQALAPLPAALAKAHELRKVSLARLAQAIAANPAGQPLPDAIRFLGGLQRVRYVFIDPVTDDVVLVGFGEAWKIDDHGSVVGATTGRPVMLLDDLAAALQAMLRPERGPITCSIDPTREGLDRLRQTVARLSSIGDPVATAEAIEQTLGPQQITIGGIAPTSHFAHVLVAADYRMKRLGMNLDPSPVPGLTSYLAMVRGGATGMQTMAPRWWLVPAYEGLATDGEGLSWELRGGSVKCLTEETLFGENGSREQAARPNPIAQQWAKTFTAKYETLSLHEPIFGELRNCMELAIVAALVAREQVHFKSSGALSVWTTERQLPLESFAVPKRTDTQVSLLRRGNRWILSASGGVEIDPSPVLSQVTKSASLAPARQAAILPADAKRWSWD